MAKKKPAAGVGKPTLTLRVSGPSIRPGRIPVPDLIVICQQAQAAVSRQAEALEGRSQTIRPGPKIGKVRAECTLELVSIGKGSATLGFDPTQTQQSIPHFARLSDDAIVSVVNAIDSVGKGRDEFIDHGVLDSLRSMGQLLENGVRSIEWIAPARPGRKRVTATLNRKAYERVVKRLTPPTTRATSIEGTLEMADFKPADLKCRIHPPLQPAINCVFRSDLSEDVYQNLRKAVRLDGRATVNSQTGRTEILEIQKITPLDPLRVNSGSFFGGWSLDQLAQLQGVGPIRDLKTLSGGLPDDEDVDEMLSDIYGRRA